MKFKYQAKTKDGELQMGFVEAADRAGASAVLAGHGLFILEVESAERVRWYDRLADYFSGVRRKDVAIFARQLATLLEARLPVSTSLKMLSEQTGHPRLRQAASEISDDIAAGLSLSQALLRQRTLFPSFYVSMIRSSEVVGNTDEVSGFLADFLERELELLSRARSALIYPAIVVVLFLVVAFIMVGFVFPQIGPIFEDSGVALPLPTRILLGTGDFIGVWWLLILFVAGTILAIVVNYLRSPEGKVLLDDLKVRMPLVHRVYVPVTLTRISNIMAMLLKGGVPVTQALEIGAETVGNVLYRDFMIEVANRVREGKSLSESIAQYPDYFPPLVSQMIAVGEATGQVNKMFTRLGVFYGREAETVLGNLVDLIQPLLMVSIGILVGLLFASILLPLYKLTASIR